MEFDFFLTFRFVFFFFCWQFRSITADCDYRYIWCMSYVCRYIHHKCRFSSLHMHTTHTHIRTRQQSMMYAFLRFSQNLCIRFSINAFWYSVRVSTNRRSIETQPQGILRVIVSKSVYRYFHSECLSPNQQ